MTSEEQGKERKRLYWVDWLRTQSVWNVVCGHIWWSVRDKTGLDRIINIYQSPWNEKSRMLEYVVDEGAFHTIPLFFLVSGYLTSTSFNIDRASLVRFFKNRFLRIWPPFLCGVVLLYIERAARGESIDIVNDLILSHLWFLWALAIIQSVAVPFCVMARMLIKRQVETKKLIICGLLHVVICVAVDVAFDVMFDISSEDKMAWLLGLPLATFISLGFFWAPGLTGTGQDIAHVVGAVWLAASTFIFTGAHEICPVSRDCGRYDWLQMNLFQAIVLIDLLHITGFCAGEVTAQAQRVLNGVIANSVSVGVLLLSCFWPFFTYWGPTFIRRNAFLKTYQAYPTFDLQVDADRALIPRREIDDDAMEGGLGPSWALARMWFWSAAMLIFAKTCCDVKVSEVFHRHITQSGMVIYIFHYLFIPAIVDALYDGGTTDPAALTYLTMLIVFSLCFVCYFVIVSNPFTANAFGIIAVDFGSVGWCGKRASKDKSLLQTV